MTSRPHAATPRSLRIAVALGIGITVAGAPASARAQSSSLAGWTALMLSPAGGLPPVPLIVDTSAGGRATQIVSRGGRWQADSTDAIHNAFGLTLSGRLSPTGAAGALTLGYVRVACEFCKHWVFGGADAQTRIRTIAAVPMGGRVARLGVALRGSFGGGFTAGDESGTAVSAAAAALLNARLPLPGSSWLDLSLTPGVGVGHLATTDGTSSGGHLVGGATMGWISSFGLGVGAGIQQVQGGQAEPGLSLLWQIR